MDPQVKVRISATITHEWSSRGITDVIPGLPEFEYGGDILTVSVAVAREIQADCDFNGNSKTGPEEMPGGARRAYRALADQLRATLGAIV